MPDRVLSSVVRYIGATLATVSGAKCKKIDRQSSYRMIRTTEVPETIVIPITHDNSTMSCMAQITTQYDAACTTTIYGRPKRQIILGDSLQKTWVLALTL
jgi:hypothetical protein